MVMSLSSSPVNASSVLSYSLDLTSDLFDSRSEPTDVPESGDELDFLTPSSRTVASRSGATSPTLQDIDQDIKHDTSPLLKSHTLRTHPRRFDAVPPAKPTTPLAKRKRTLLDFDGFDKKPQEKGRNGTKRAKMDDKKAVSAALSFSC
jgi:hypothetical protein